MKINNPLRTLLATAMLLVPGAASAATDVKNFSPLDCIGTNGPISYYVDGSIFNDTTGVLSVSCPLVRDERLVSGAFFKMLDRALVGPSGREECTLFAESAYNAGFSIDSDTAKTVNSSDEYQQRGFSTALDEQDYYYVTCKLPPKNFGLASHLATISVTELVF